MNLPKGVYLLDGLNQLVLKDGVSFTMITRTNLDNNHFLMEVYDESNNTGRSESGWKERTDL